MPSFTVIRNNGKDGLREDAAGEWYLASIQSWSSAQNLITADLFAAFPFGYVTGYISPRCTLCKRITLQYLPEWLLHLSTQKSKPVLARGSGAHNLQLMNPQITCAGLECKEIINAGFRAYTCSRTWWPTPALRNLCIQMQGWRGASTEALAVCRSITFYISF